MYESTNQSWIYFINFINLYLNLATTLTIPTVTLLTTNLITLSTNIAVAKKVDKAATCNLVHFGAEPDMIKQDVLKIEP